MASDMDIKLGDKIEVSALELTMWLDGCICEALDEACEREIDTTVFAKRQVLEFFNRKKKVGTEVPCFED